MPPARQKLLFWRPWHFLELTPIQIDSVLAVFNWAVTTSPSCSSTNSSKGLEKNGRRFPSVVGGKGSLPRRGQAPCAPLPTPKPLICKLLHRSVHVQKPTPSCSFL